MDEIRLPDGCLIVLVGRSGAGKSTWAERYLHPDQIVSSDGLRAVVGASESDQRAGTDAFAVLDAIVTARLRRRLTTVVDTMALDPAARAGYVRTAAEAGVPCHAIVFDADDEAVAERNATRRWPLSKRSLASQRRAAARALQDIHDDGFTAVHTPAPLRIVPTTMLDAPVHRRRQEEHPVNLTFGLQISSFAWPGGPPSMGGDLATIARTAEEAGFTSLWVMDHFRQIPQIGREWEDMPEGYSVLAYLAAVTERATLGTLVTGVGYRNPAHLGKILATLDVLSGGRAVCGLGIGWFEKEATAYGWDWPSVRQRYELLEDTLELLPLLWGAGSPEFRGRIVHVPEAMCYPRPLQDTLPILVGGGGEKRTLRIVARHADMCNLFGDPDAVRHKLAVLHRHCSDLERDPNEITVTHLSQMLTAASEADLRRRLETMRGPDQTAEQVAERLGAGTIDEQIGRYRALADAGVQHAIVAPADPADLEVLRAFGGVIDAFT